MSNQQYPHDEDIPRLDPWLAVMASSVIPLIVALYVHSRFVVPLIVVTIALFLASLVMLRRQTVRRRVDQRAHSLGDARPVARSFDRQTLEIEGAEP